MPVTTPTTRPRSRAPGSPATSNGVNPQDPANWDPNHDITKSPMWPYCGQNLGIWKCPADRSFVVVNGEAKPRVRSMSMNFYLGGFGGWDGSEFLDTGSYKLYFKQTELADPGPAKVFVFLDMRSDSIDIGNFAPRMTRLARPARAYGFYDLPGCYHNLACGFSFADGHSETHRWRDGRTTPPSGGQRQYQRPVFLPEQPRRRLAARPCDAAKVVGRRLACHPRKYRLPMRLRFRHGRFPLSPSEGERAGVWTFWKVRLG